MILPFANKTFHIRHFRYGSRTTAEEGVQAYGGSYSSVTYSGNIRNEIGVMQFPCNEIAKSDGSLGTRPSENRKEGLGDRLGSKCTERNVWNL